MATSMPLSINLARALFIASGFKAEQRQFGARFNGTLQDGDTALDHQSRKARMAALALDYEDQRLRLTLDAIDQREQVDAPT
eukprot:gene21272-41288_t